MTNTDRLRKALKTFSRDTRISSINNTDPCTIGEYKELVQSIEKLFKAFIDELEKD